MRIGIIARGKVGQALGKSLQAAGETFVGLTAARRRARQRRQRS
jgi:predicted dinucleotide-binding enzyme